MAWQGISVSGKPTTEERAARQLVAGHRVIVGKIGAAAAFKSYGISLPKPISTPKATPASPLPKRMATSKTFSAVRLHRFSAGGMFS